MTANLLSNLGLATLARGDPERATELLEEGLAISQQLGALGDKLNLAELLMSLACTAGAEGKALRAARLRGAAQGLHESSGISSLDVEGPDTSERFLATARSQVEEAAWERAWEEGRAMNLDQAISYALENTEEHT